MPLPDPYLPGYPDLSNRGDQFDNPGNRWDAEGVGFLLTAGGSATLTVLASNQLTTSAASLPGYGESSGGGAYPWGTDPLDVAAFDDPTGPWAATITWSVTRQTFDAFTTSVSGVIVATDAAPNGWDVSLGVDDIARAFLGNPVLGAHPGDPFSWEPPYSGSVKEGLTVTAPSAAPYGMYAVTYSAHYHLDRALPGYSGRRQTADLNLYPVAGTAIIRAGTPHFTIAQDAALSASGTLTDITPTGGPGHYAFTASTPAPSYLEALLTLDGMPSEELYLGPKLVILRGDAAPGVNTIPDLGDWADPAGYTALLPSPYAEATEQTVGVMLPTGAATGGSQSFRVNVPLFAGAYTYWFFPWSFFGPPELFYPGGPDGDFDYPHGVGEYSTRVGLYEFWGGTAPLPGAGLVPPPEMIDTLAAGLTPPFTCRLDVTVTAGGGGGHHTPPTVFKSPANLGKPSRNYHRAEESDAGLLYRRSLPAVPRASVGWQDASYITTNPADGGPSLFKDHRDLLYVAFQRGAATADPNVYVSRSDDDGATWNPPIMAIPGGAHPTSASDNGRAVCAAVTTTGGGTGAVRHLMGAYKGPGDRIFGTPWTFTDTTGAPLVVADDSFGIVFTAEGPDRMALHVLMAGEAATSDWWSGDVGRTWTRIPLT